LDLIWAGLREAVGLLARADPELLQIALLTLGVSLAATLVGALVGIPLGALLAIRRFRGRGLANALVNTGMGLPPVVVGLGVTILLWRTGPFGFLGMLYTPGAMAFAQFLVAAPLVAGFTRAALELIDPEVLHALRADGAGGVVAARELVFAAGPQVLVAVAAGFGRAIAEVGASLMVGGNLAGQTRILTTAITLETSRGDFARAIALGLVLLALAFLVNVGLAWRGRTSAG
jgi:tungstate transport system permease protein